MKSRPYLTTLVLLAIALVTAHWILRSLEIRPGVHEARWIWAEQRDEQGTPMAFFAVRDFDLDFEPTAATLWVAADEEYQVGLNSDAFGVGRLTHSEGGAVVIDHYRVEDVLEVGSNQLAIEARSSRGAGGLMAHLDVEGANGERWRLSTDEAWRIVRGAPAEGRFPPGGEEPVVWGRAPSGRWAKLDSSGDETLTLGALQGERRIRPQLAERWRRPREPWQKAEGYLAPRIGPWVTFDFGRERTGFVNLKYDDGQSSAGRPGVGFLYYSRHEPKDGLEHPDEVILRVRGRTNWAPSRPATFRFVTAIGSPSIVAAEILPVDPRIAAERLLRPTPGSLFGVDRKKTLMSPAEHELRRQLEGFPGLAGRKEG